MFNWIKKINLKVLFKEKKFILSLIVSLFLNVFIWIYLLIAIKFTVEPIPLHYNIYYGIDLIGNWYKIFYIPFFGLLIIFINFIFSSIIYGREKIISYFLTAITIFSQAILLLAAIFTSFQNI